MSSTLRDVDHRRSGEQAEKFGSNRQEIISAWGDEFEKLPEKQKRAAVERVRRRHPLPYPRTGRGNRGTNPAFTSTVAG